VKSAQQRFPLSSPPLSPQRESGLSLLHDFLPRIPHYRSQRNYDIPGESFVSGLSPYLRYRLVRECEVIDAVLDNFSYEEASSFIEEVAWRTYWKGYLEARPTIWTDYLSQVATLPGQLDDLDMERWQSVLEGRSGIECFDYWVQLLKTTGWLHNHARMWFASIWVFTLKLPWELGAAFFLEHLLDGDPASNTLSWRWVGGLHTKGKHYIARAGNISKYTGGMFNPEGQLNENPEPLPAGREHHLIPFNPVTSFSGMDFPTLSQSPAGLLVCPEDLTPELGPLVESPFTSFCIFNATDIMDVSRASGPVQQFINGAVQDSAHRMAQHWGAQVMHVDASLPMVTSKALPGHVGRREDPRIYAGCIKNWVQGVISWAGNENLKSVWMIQPPVGPWKDHMPLLRASLGARNIRFHEYRTQWDSLNWDYATSGYFKFRKTLRDRITRMTGPKS
jgi:deoxyribodipyrimidine photo-lyase